MSKEITIEVPDEFFTLWSSEEPAAEDMKKLFVLGLVWKKKISQGRGAELLEMNRSDFMSLVAEYNIPAININTQELGSGKNTFRKAMKK